MSLSTWNLHSPCSRCFFNLLQGVCKIQMDLPNWKIKSNYIPLGGGKLNFFGVGMSGVGPRKRESKELIFLQK